MYVMFLANGFEETEALVPLDLMRRAGIEVTTVGIGGRTVTGSHGIPVTADAADADFAGVASFDGIILPGGMPGTINLDSSPFVDSALKSAFAENKLIAAICAAPSVPGKRGMLSGRRAVCFPGFEDKLTGSVRSEARVETDKNIITAVGMGAAYEFGLALIAYIKGSDAAAAVAKSGLLPACVIPR